MCVANASERPALPVRSDHTETATDGYSRALPKQLPTLSEQGLYAASSLKKKAPLEQGPSLAGGETRSPGRFNPRSCTQRSLV